MDYIFSSANPRIAPMYFAIAVILAVLAGVITEHYRRKERISMEQSITVVLLTTYIFLVFASTVFSRTSKDYYSYELIPFWSYWKILNGSKSLFWEDVLNILMLSPIGILVPIMIGDEEGRMLRRVILIGFLISLTIELLQLVMKRGLFEFDDMFHNTVGVVIGYWFCRRIRKKRNRIHAMD